MTKSHLPRLAIPSVLPMLVFLGCASPASQSFRSSFLPPAPRPTAAPSTASTPKLVQFSETEVSETPLVLTLAPSREIPNFLRFEPRPAFRERSESRFKRAEQAFERGKRAYREGDFLAARREFDTAIETLLSGLDGDEDRSEFIRRFEELVDRIHRYDVEGLGAGDDPQIAGYDRSPLQEILEMTFPVDPSLKGKVLDQIRATSSELPLEENDEVLRYINFFSSEQGRKTLLAGLRRAGRYQEMIRSILAEEGVPQELIFLAQAESGFMPRALSPKSAAGLWQFVQWRGREYGLLQTAYSDDRLDPEKATRAGARHLKDLYNQFGDWYLAMAAYNCGPGCVQNAVRRTGYADFWTLRRLGVLPRETANYVPLILAITIIVKNARDYGIDLDHLDVEPPLVYDTLKLEANTNLLLMADLLEISPAELRELNPALLGNLAPAGYEIHVPKGSASSLLSALALIPAEKRALWRAHRLADGETLASVAARFGVHPSRILTAGQGLQAEPQSGDLLLIPGEPVSTAKRSLARRSPAKRSATKRPSATAGTFKQPSTKTTMAKAQASKPTARRAAIPQKSPRSGPALAYRYPQSSRSLSR